MKAIEKIAVIGGTGKSGKYLVKELITRNLKANIFVRNPDHYYPKHDLMTPVFGNVNDYDSVRILLTGCEAIISCLGLGVPPSESDIFTKSTSNILKAMKELGIKRYIAITGLNVDTPADQKSEPVVSATNWMKSNFPATTLNKQQEYDILSKSNADWTLVRLPMIELTDIKSGVTAELNDCKGDKISASNLADFLIDQLTSQRYIRQAPFISNA